MRNARAAAHLKKAWAVLKAKDLTPSQWQQLAEIRVRLESKPPTPPKKKRKRG